MASDINPVQPEGIRGTGYVKTQISLQIALINPGVTSVQQKLCTGSYQFGWMRGLYYVFRCPYTA